jgi:hypothetical protein
VPPKEHEQTYVKKKTAQIKYTVTILLSWKLRMERGYKVNGSVRDYAKETTVYGVLTSRLSALPRQLL